MRSPIYERPRGLTNGVNTTFRTSAPYRVESLLVMRNGLALQPSAWTTDPLDRTVFVLLDPPVAEDSILVYYQPV